MSLVEDDEDHGGHHLPAVEDWPRGFGEASWWPIITGTGASGIYVGAALFVMTSGGSDLVPAITGPAIIVASIGLFLVGLYGWLYHAFVSTFWSRGTDSHGSRALRFGMLLFLGTEISTFGAGFIYYFFIRANAWPPLGGELPGLLNTLVLINTVLLLSSSVTLHFAHTSLRKGNRGRFLGLLGLTVAIGAVFLGGQVYEYYEFIIHEGFTLTSGIFGSAFFGLTGLHGLHVTMGVVLLSIVFLRGFSGQYSASRHTSMSTVTMYWHFVDVVWIFLVAVLYVGAAIGGTVAA